MGEPASVLVADDEPLLVHLIRRLLQREGYRVLAAASPEEVRRGLEAPSLTAVLFDMRMFPDAAACLRAARARHPDARLVLMSGEFPSPSLEQALVESTASFLKKPFALSALLERLA